MMRTLLLVSLAACGGAKPVVVASGEKAAAPAAAAAATPAPAAGHPRSDLIPRSILFGNPERAAVRLSPDGKHLAWLAPSKGVMNVWVAPVGDLEKAQPLTAETTRPIGSYWWTYTNQHILYQQDVGGDENFHIFRADLLGGPDAKTVDLTPFPGARAGLERISDRQPTSMVVTINDRDPKVFDVYKIDLLTGKRTLLAKNEDDFIGFTVDRDLAVRFASKKLPDGATQLFVPAKKGWKAFDTIPFEDSETTGIVAMAPDRRSVYFTDSRGRDTAALVAIDLATRKQKVIAEDDRADAADVMLHPTKETVQAVGFTYDRLQWKVLDRSIQKDLDALAKLDGAEVHITSRSRDDKTWVVATTSEQHPGRYYLWDRAKQTSRFLFAAQPALEEQPLVKMWPVIIKARDGLELVSYLTLPKSADPDADGQANAPSPMVLFVHGGPWSRDEWGYDPIHQLLANRGYAVLSVNYRGSTGFGKKFLNASTREWSKKMHDDLLDAVSWAVEHKVAPRDQIAIMGGSYGGYATLVGLAMTPEVFRCGVDIVGPSNLLTLLASIPPYWAPIMALFKARIGDPDTAEGKQLLTDASPLTRAADIKRPLLIGQGANDPRVKQAESEQIVAAMKQRGLQVSYVLFPDEGHGFHRPVNNIAFFGAAEAFLSAHLGGSYLPLTAEEVSASTMQIKEGKDGIPGAP